MTFGRKPPVNVRLEDSLKSNPESDKTFLLSEDDIPVNFLTAQTTYPELFGKGRLHTHIFSHEPL